MWKGSSVRAYTERPARFVAVLETLCRVMPSTVARHAGAGLRARMQGHAGKCLEVLKWYWCDVMAEMARRGVGCGGLTVPGREGQTGTPLCRLHRGNGRAEQVVTFVVTAGQSYARQFCSCQSVIIRSAVDRLICGSCI